MASDINEFIDYNMTNGLTAFRSVLNRALSASKACWNYEFDDILGTSRKSEIVIVRHAIWVKLHENNMPYMWIARLFNRDHSTVMTCCNKHPWRLRTDSLYRKQWYEFERIYNKLGDIND